MYGTVQGFRGNWQPPLKVFRGVTSDETKRDRTYAQELTSTILNDIKRYQTLIIIPTSTKDRLGVTTSASTSSARKKSTCLVIICLNR